MRVLRRALRGWKREVLSFWARFTTFHRVVFGVLLAMAAVYGLRVVALDPLQKEVKTLTDKLAKDGVPAIVPLTATDEEVQQNRLKAESARDSLKESRAELEQAQKNSPYRLQATLADASAAILGLASASNLRVRENSDTTAPEGGELAVAAKQFELRGDFVCIREFLSQAEQEPYLWEITDLSIRLSTDERGEPELLSRGRPVLALRFRLLLYLYRSGA